MRSIGQAEVALALMIERAESRVAFGTTLSTQGVIRQDMAKSRIEIEMCRLLTLQAAHMIDTAGIKNPATRQYVAMIKVIGPTMAKTIVGTPHILSLFRLSAFQLSSLSSHLLASPPSVSSTLAASALLSLALTPPPLRRPRHPGARRYGCVPGHPSRAHVGRPPHPAACRRTR
jgi:hypothetical protein